MPSPFPGMDPWLEGEEVFPDLHDSLIFLLKEAINTALPPGYVATSRNRVWVDDELRREPDVALFGKDREPGSSSSAIALAGLVAVGQQLTPEPIEEPYLEIVSAKGKRLVTAIEIISLTNKRAGEQGRKTYTDKQHEYRLSGVHLVEVDLLRRGPHVAATPLAHLRKIFGEFDYHVSVVVAGAVPRYHAAGIKLVDRLPEFAIPLDTNVPPVTVNLQPLLDRCYDSGKYAALTSYREPCDPPLTPEQQVWAEGILRAKGLLP
ncbi:hypothetical protein VT84_25715 [Gemmata sp. SH-PL17]|uniref:DUF4058 family protein n=1 Tax=Gemmata sp. SH-PL17 TaxID=1630693 RepID=UPI00078E6249|nr:DUF4058 family protein [Gemmata sp. SH-PL17]AMV27826.1 hypothetical protein VT84_25715 [Gemmata sp. SH-PL17]